MTPTTEQLKLVAEKVMGWREVTEANGYSEKSFCLTPHHLFKANFARGGFCNNPWNPVTNAEDFQELLEAVSKRKMVTFGQSKRIGGFCAFDYGISIPDRGFPTASEALFHFAIELAENI